MTFLLTGTTAASTMYTFHDFTFLKFRFWDSADAVGSEIGVTRLNASQATQIFIAGFFPLSNKICVRDFLFQTIVIKLSRNNLSPNIHVVNVAGFLMVDFKDRPERLIDSLSFMWFGLG